MYYLNQLTVSWKVYEIWREKFPVSKQVFVAREISKKFETHFLGSASDCLQWVESDKDQQKGEFVLVLQGSNESEIEAVRQEAALKILELLGSSISTKDAVAIASEISGARRISSMRTL
ncbi:MAG: hypothetical protein Ct9H300mP22_7600 [Gammaproteobacteria bacterium]|nr:MAG: hypothetical protein Ct9H300mP22_7600 [Gammaproteobacteria bacterium]